MKKLLLYAIACCLAVSLCGCQQQSSVPVEPQPSSSNAVASGSTPGSMTEMDLTSMEQFYLSAFCAGGSESAVYEIQLADDEPYTNFTATLYRYQNGKWEKAQSFQAEIKDTVSHFAVNYSDLATYHYAFKSGSSAKYLDSAESDDQSQFTEGYSYHTDLNTDFLVSTEETPLIAYRRYDINGEEKRASLHDFFSPDEIPDDEIEEYYMLTVSFS